MKRSEMEARKDVVALALQLWSARAMSAGLAPELNPRFTQSKTLFG